MDRGTGEWRSDKCCNVAQVPCNVACNGASLAALSCIWHEPPDVGEDTASISQQPAYMHAKDEQQDLPDGEILFQKAP